MNPTTYRFFAKGKAILSALIALGLLGTSATGKKIARVFVDSVASEAYAEGKEQGEAPSFETYHFLEGNFFGGLFRDSSLGKVDFQILAENLAVEMRKRNYYPAAESRQGNLLVVIHYGVTGVQDSFAEMFEDFESIEPSDPFSEEEAEDPFETDFTSFDQTNDNDDILHGDRVNAKILGFRRALNRRGLTRQEEYELRSALRDERYFIILMAYDWQKLLTEKEVKLLWSTRFSVDSIGTNFVDAYPALTRAASAYFGTHLDKYTIPKTHFGTGEVEFGELEVIEAVEEEDPRADELKRGR